MCICPIDQHCDILSFQFIHVYNSHQIIVEVCNRLEKLQIEQTLVLINYPLLTQLSVGLLYILGNSFDKIAIEIYADKGYRIILETYRPDEKILNHLRTVLAASYNTRNENMAIWSIMPMTILYGKIHRYIYKMETFILQKYIFIKIYVHISVQNI